MYCYDQLHSIFFLHPDLMVHDSNPSTKESGAGEQWVPGQFWQQRHTVFKKQNSTPPPKPVQFALWGSTRIRLNSVATKRSRFFHVISRMDKSHLIVSFAPLELQTSSTVCLRVIRNYLPSQCLFQYTCLYIPDTCSLVQYTLYCLWRKINWYSHDENQVIKQSSDEAVTY